MEIFLLQKASCCTLTSMEFPELYLCLLVLKNDQSKIILVPQRRILGWQVLFPFISFSHSVLRNP